MSFLNLQQPENDLTINILRDHPTSSSSSLLSSLHNVEQRVFSCSYCRRKFYSPQAFGGHQNAHKLERTLAKKSRELSSAARHQPAEWNNAPSRFNPYGSKHIEQFEPTVVTGFQHQEKFGSTEEMGKNLDYGHKGDNVEDDLNNLDLSLKL